MNDKITNTGPDRCPKCLTEVDRAAAVKGSAVPVPGDVSICMYCAAYLQFSSDMALVELPDVVFDTLDPAVKNTLSLSRAVIKANPIKRPIHNIPGMSLHTRGITSDSMGEPIQGMQLYTLMPEGDSWIVLKEGQGDSAGR